MFSRKTTWIALVVAALTVGFIVLNVSIGRYGAAYDPDRVTVPILAPFQKIVTGTVRSVRGVWRRYFHLVSTVRENEKLRRELARATGVRNRCRELELANDRLRKLLAFKKQTRLRAVAAEVIAKDPSPWFKSILIDKGTADGVEKGMPVVISQGIAGLVTLTTRRYSKVLLIIDPNSAVDALVQRTRARGIVTGKGGNRCLFKYVLSKHDIRLGDMVVSSGLDRVFPKGLSIGTVVGVARFHSGIFQEVIVDPRVDFERLEEVLVVLKPRRRIHWRKR